MPTHPTTPKRQLIASSFTKKESGVHFGPTHPRIRRIAQRITEYHAEELISMLTSPRKSLRNNATSILMSHPKLLSVRQLGELTRAQHDPTVAARLLHIITSQKKYHPVMLETLSRSIGFLAKIAAVDGIIAHGNKTIRDAAIRALNEQMTSQNQVETQHAIWLLNNGRAQKN